MKQGFLSNANANILFHQTSTKPWTSFAEHARGFYLSRLLNAYWKHKYSSFNYIGIILLLLYIAFLVYWKCYYLSCAAGRETKKESTIATGSSCVRSSHFRSQEANATWKGVTFGVENKWFGGQAIWVLPLSLHTSHSHWGQIGLIREPTGYTVQRSKAHSWIWL